MGKAFSTLKSKLTKEPILYAPNYNSEFVIQTDAFQKGVGAVLAQRQDSEDYLFISVENSRILKKASVLPNGNAQQ